MDENLQKSAFTSENLPEEEIDLRQLFFTFSKYKWSILALAVTLTVLASHWAYSLVPIYRATTSLLIETEEAKVISIEEVYGLQGGNWEYYETQLHILRSRALARKVFDSLNLEKHPEYLPSKKQKSFIASLELKKKIMNLLSGDSIDEDNTSAPSIGEDKLSTPVDENRRKNILVGGLMGRLEIKLLKDSQIVTISYDSEYPELSANIPNALAEAYINSFLEADLEKTQKATGWITVRTGELRKKFEESERQLQAFIEKENLVDVEGLNNLAAMELETLTSNLVEARSKRSEARALYQQVKSIKGSHSLEQLESLPAVLNHPLINVVYNKRAEAQGSVSELSKRYGPKHPKMIAAVSELKTAESNLRKQIDNIVQSVAKEYEIIRAEESHLSLALNRTKSQVKETNKKSYKLAALQREVETNRQLYEIFLTRFKETAATSDLQTVNARVIDLAVEPLAPYKPDRQRIILIAFLLSLMFGFGLALLIEYLDDTFRDSTLLEEKLRLPVLGVIPKMTAGDLDNNGMFFFIKEPKSGFSESIRTIRTGIMFSSIDAAHKVIVVTSSVPGEGKSLVSINLAISISQMKKTLLIDADMRKPTVAAVFGLDKSAKGLSELVSTDAEFSDCIHGANLEGMSLDVLPAGIVPPNPLELLSSIRFKIVIEKLKNNYEYIIIDSAPAAVVSDSRVLAKIGDSVVYVVKADDTTHHIAQRGVKLLLESGAHITGSVLNQVDRKRQSKDSVYDGNYYSYYGYR